MRERSGRATWLGRCASSPQKWLYFRIHSRTQYKQKKSYFSLPLKSASKSFRQFYIFSPSSTLYNEVMFRGRLSASDSPVVCWTFQPNMCNIFSIITSSRIAISHLKLAFVSHLSHLVQLKYLIDDYILASWIKKCIFCESPIDQSTNQTNHQSSFNEEVLQN